MPLIQAMSSGMNRHHSLCLPAHHLSSYGRQLLLSSAVAGNFDHKKLHSVCLPVFMVNGALYQKLFPLENKKL